MRWDKGRQAGEEEDGATNLCPESSWRDRAFRVVSNTLAAQLDKGNTSSYQTEMALRGEWREALRENFTGAGASSKMLY